MTAASSVAHDAAFAAQQADLRHGLRLAGLPILTTAGADYDRAWRQLAREAEVDRYLGRPTTARAGDDVGGQP